MPFVMLSIREHVALQSYTTFGIAATARYFAEVETVEQLRWALEEARRSSWPVWVLGGGSNVLFTQDLQALVLRIALRGVEVVYEDAEVVKVKVGAGEPWHDWVLYAIQKGWGGLENLSLIPGTVGAAPMQNIGAYGVEIKDVFEELEAVERSTGLLRRFDTEACAFGYRESVFKHVLKDQYIITSVTFRLSKRPVLNTRYGDIQQTLQAMGVTSPTIAEVSEAVIRIRKSKLPDPAELGNAGSFFKNPEIPTAQFEQLKALYPTLPGYVVSATHTKVPAGWLIEQAGWKGYREGQVGVHARQALVLVNYGGGTGEEVVRLSEKIQASVAEKFGIHLVPEVNKVSL